MNSTAHRPAKPLAVFLAGLQAGMIGICWMLAWLGLSAMGQRRSFWTAENLMASVFHGDAAIRRGFGFSTLSGIALYLLIYSLLGALFAGGVVPGLRRASATARSSSVRWAQARWLATSVAESRSTDPSRCM